MTTQETSRNYDRQSYLICWKFASHDCVINSNRLKATKNGWQWEERLLNGHLLAHRRSSLVSVLIKLCCSIYSFLILLCASGITSRNNCWLFTFHEKDGCAQREREKKSTTILIIICAFYFSMWPFCFTVIILQMKWIEGEKSVSTKTTTLESKELLPNFSWTM